MSLAENRGFQIHHAIVDDRNQEVHDVALGKSVTVSLQYQISNDQHQGSAATQFAYAMIVDLIPAGFEIDRSSIRNNPSLYADIREDRVIFFVPAGPTMNEIKYKLNAISQGHFQVAPTMIEDMYTPGDVAITQANTINAQ
jgi:uncharacterized protein YfaS (alpha-2-macroglobulin family)